MNFKIQPLLIGSIAILHFANIVRGQDIPGGIRDSINSVVLKEKRMIEVLLPKSYKPSSGDKYDVLYVTDGERSAKLMVQIQQFMEEVKLMPPTIIVSVPNMFPQQRVKDFLPSHSSNFPLSGGADDFLTFLGDELIPYINKKYPSNGDNTIFGHSLGGVFVMYALLTKPQYFEAYLAADPSFWWDNGYMQKLAKEKLISFPELNRAIFISGRAGKGLKEMGITSMDSILRVGTPTNLHWQIIAYANEDHSSLKLKSIYDGLKFINAGYSNKKIEFHPMNGIVLQNKPFKILHNCDSLARYTLDGTTPVFASSRLDSEINLSESATLIVKLFFNLEKYSKSAFGTFRTGKVLAARAIPRGVTPGGLQYFYYEGIWKSLPDFKKLKPVQIGHTNKEFSLSKLPGKTNFACLFKGYLEIQKDGYYSFALDSDEGSKLYLGGTLLIDYDGLHSKGTPQSYVIPLERGFYSLRLEYFQKEGGTDLKLMYNTPESEKYTTIPFELQYSER